MFWRQDPSGKSPKTSNLPAWPRNGAVLRGVVVEFAFKPENCVKWLQVNQYTQAGTSSVVDLPAGVFMPFEQGGLLLHEVKTP